jgi:hypothetical protein
MKMPFLLLALCKSGIRIWIRNYLLFKEDPNPDPKLRRKWDPNPDPTKIVSDPQHCFGTYHALPLYFKGYGEAMANVTVLPALRLNLPPRAVIVPASQTVTLPTSSAILDGTQSSDDSGTVASYAWEIHSGPLGYQPVLPSVPTLTLENLVAGKLQYNKAHLSLDQCSGAGIRCFFTPWIRDPDPG